MAEWSTAPDLKAEGEGGQVLFFTNNSCKYYKESSVCITGKYLLCYRETPVGITGEILVNITGKSM